MGNTKGTSSINSPKGGGALAGLGEKFSPDLFSGTGNFSVPIAVPPGRNGFQPELSLGYSSGSGNGIFGLGWALGIPGVTRKTSKGIPLYDDKSDIFILSGAEDLVPVKIEKNIETDGIQAERTTYRPRTEGLFARIERYKKVTGEHYWKVWSKDGFISYYGTEILNGSSDDSVVANPEKRDSIFAWHLSKTEDPFGNVILYEYLRDLITSGDRPYDQLYVSNIKYAQYPDPNNSLLTKYLCQVRFVYEDRTDPFSAYKQGFEVRTAKRCARVETFTDTVTEIKTKTYHFTYANDALNGTSMLKEVSVEGHNGTESEFMPPLMFGYSDFRPDKRDLYPIKGQLPGVSLAEPGFELVDLDGNGLPDILQLNGIARRWPNLGNGKFGSPLTLDIAPSVNLAMSGVQLIDADGDGKSDLLVNDGVKAGYFPGRFRTVWDNKSFRPYPQVPSFSFADPEVRLIDLDGDGVTDVLRNGSRFECFFNDPEKGFYDTRFTNKTFADFSFADPRIRFADMTGDGMQDIVLISSGKVQYWPNLGYGRFGNKVIMRNAPRFPEEYDPAQILLGDLDGDGLTDMAYVEDNEVRLYINQSGNGFADERIIHGTPRVQSANALRITDILGTGQSGILWSYGAGEYSAGQMFFLDFTAGNKPYLLQEMNNNMGSVTRVKYGSSVYHYLRDEAKPVTRWQTDLPFPVLVVNKMEVLDLLSGGKMVTEYLYHHGYWDGAEREFRGFARVDVRDTETFEKYNTNDLFTEEFTGVELEHYTPPTETRNWFYPGPVGDGYGKWFEVDFTHEYWTGDTPYFQRSQTMKDLLAGLPRRARRDALRTLRGTMLRSELYALDNSPLSDKPYTVTESMMELRLEFDPSQLPAPLWAETQGGYSAGGGYIFFPFNTAQRTTQWERGDDPMHSFSFTKGYDAYGQPTGQMSVGVPRYANPLYGGSGEYLATYGFSEYIEKVTDEQYMVTRAKRSVSYDATRNAVGMSVFGLRDWAFDAATQMPVIGATLNYYDGAAFVGLAYGEIDKYGALVRSEALILTEEIVEAAYGGVPVLLQDNPTWPAEYPAEFKVSYPNMGGYLFKTNNQAYPITGWYAEGVRMKYDFQVTSPFCGLMLETQDPFGNTSLAEYDDYRMFPILSVDTLGMQIQAEYDYRTMQVYRMTDPNLNISEFDFSPLGMLRATALIGKGTEGDYKSAGGTFYDRFEPSSIMEYSFSSFMDEGNPVWVKTTLREKHYQQSINSPTITKVEYSDGFGRLMQTRVQAEDVIFGNQTFGSSGLSVNQTSSNGPAVGIERNPNDPLNVTVSGWQIYNNKGKVVEKYEPFFSQGFDYELPQTFGVKIKMYYDSRGQGIRTVNPDGTEQRVVFGIPLSLSAPDNFLPTAWESYKYDSNDLAPITHPTDTTVAPSHYFTPKSELFDGLGRSIRTTEHMDTSPSVVNNIIMDYRYDIRGNLKEVIDPYGRSVFSYEYNLSTPEQDEKLPPLSVKHIDGGIKTIIFNSVGQSIQASDSKGSLVLSTHDVAMRPVRFWARDSAGETMTLRQILIYGDQSDLSDPASLNQNGKLYTHYDEAGLTTIHEYDFKGNSLNSTRKCISDAELLSIFSPPPANWAIDCYRVDWTGMPDILDIKEFNTDLEYDALSRVIKAIYPVDMDNERKVGIPTYDKAGKLEKLTFDGVDYIKHIAYNAKGQRLMVAYGNTIMTRYAYDPRNSSLLRLKSEKYSQADYEFTPLSGTKQDYAYVRDLMGNIITIKDRSPECGVGGTDFIDKKFTHDPIYRLLTANGRETAKLEPNPWDETHRPHDTSLSVSYNQSYSYDKIGNILSLVHYSNGVHDFTRTFGYSTTNNKLNNITVDGDTYTYSYDASGNQLSETTTRRSEWDYGDKMRCYYNQTGTSQPSVYALYLYDAGGSRVKKLVRTSGGGYESISYIGDSYEYKTDGTEEQTTLHLKDGRIRVATIRMGYDFDDTSPAIKYNLDDHLGTSVLELNEYGTKKRREEYYPFGETSFGSYAKKRYRYCGKEKDNESGLYYYGARYYSAWTCRFISVDPLAESYAQLSPYNYASNSPIDGIDIDGMQTSNDNQEKSKSGEYIGNTYVGNPNNIGINPKLQQIDWRNARKAPQTIEISAEMYEILQKQASMVMYPQKQAYIGMPEPEWKYWAPTPSVGWRIYNIADNMLNFVVMLGGAGVNYQIGGTRPASNGIGIGYCSGGNVSSKAPTQTETPIIVKQNNAKSTSFYKPIDNSIENPKFTAPQLPEVGGGAKLEYLGNNVGRIQAISIKYKITIAVVGSRAKGTSDAYSDWDYIITGGTSKGRSSALYELPKNPNAIKDGMQRPGSEVLKGVDINPDLPYIIFYPF